MPPTRAALGNRAMAGNTLLNPKGVLTRSKRTTENTLIAGKRKAVNSPPKERAVKRSAFGDLTNAAGKSVLETKKVLKSLTNASVAKPVAAKVVPKAAAATQERAALKDRENLVPKRGVSAATVGRTALKAQIPAALKKAETETAPAAARRSGRLTRRSLLSNSDDNSLYVSALDDSGDGVSFTAEITQKVSETVISVPAPRPVRAVPPAGIEDFDALHWEDPNQVGNYAHDIFEYLKRREADFIVKDYMDNQIHLNKWMRSLLVDWMVECQENFELNHETLYLAVKLVDMYLSKAVVRKENLQLVGAASLFIASKFDERIPPLVEDLIFICDGAYTHSQLIRKEVDILKAIDFELGIPLSYRFQRRYARCAHIPMPQLTLARYILELSLMEYNFVTCSDSKLGAAALLLALKMQHISTWTPTLQYYSGYKLGDIKDIVIELNEMLHKKPKDALMTVRKKYSHPVFFEVAKVSLIATADLFITEV